MDHPAASGLTIRLFGSFEAFLGDAPLPRLRTRKGQWLLALLALRPGTEAARDWLAGVLWPESAEPTALANLRSVLKDLRHALGAEAHRLRCPTTRTLALDLAGADVDVREFDAALARGNPDSLRQAVALYRGPLLEGCSEEWAFQERQARELACLEVLEVLAAQALADKDAAAAEHYLRRAAAVDPLRESAQRALMQALAAGGNYAAAVLVYRELRQRLHREINAAPDAETTALYQQLRAEARQRAQDRPADGIKASPAHRRADPLATGSLPLPLTSFIGREPELARLREWLLSAHDEESAPGDGEGLVSPHPSCLPTRPSRLVTLTGPGGTGKTRLANEVARGLHAAFDGAVWFVPLLDLTDSRLIADQVLLSLRLPRSPQTTALEQAAAFLAREHALLVLDNFEHLVEGGTETVRALLGRVESLTILVTSRRSLGLEGEREFPVAPLPVPGEGEGCRGREGLSRRTLHPSPFTLMQFPSVQLFIDRAQAVRPDFQLTNANAAALAALCTGLEGLPLAIELAAARAGVLTPQQMHLHLERRFELLRGRSQAADPRHRSLREALDWSYQLLPLEQQRFLARLSVFRGGWTLEAARVVCDQPLALDYLSQLRDSSLVIAEEQGEEMRYRMLETIREYADQALTAAAEADSTRQRHARFFVAWVEETQPAGPGVEDNRWLDMVEREHDNLRRALAWLVNTAALPEKGPSPEMALRFGSMLDRFWGSRGYWREGREWLQRLLARPWALEHTTTRADLLYKAGQFEQLLEDLDAARVLIGESLALYREVGHRPGIAEALRSLSTLYIYLDRDYETARCQIEEGLTLWRELGDPEGITRGLSSLAGLNYHLGNLEEAWRLWEECAARWRELGNQRGLYSSLFNLRMIAMYREDDEAARRILLEYLAILRSQRNKTGIAEALAHLGVIAYRLGDLAAAGQHWEEGLAIAREQEQPAILGHLLRDVGQVALVRGDYAAARSYFHEALEVGRELGAERLIGPPIIAAALEGLGDVASALGDLEEARAHYREALRLWPQLRWSEALPKDGPKAGMARCLAGLGKVAGKQGRWDHSARLLGTVAAQREALGVRLPPPDAPEWEQSIAAIRSALGEPAFTAAWAEGHATSLEQAVADALNERPDG